MRTGTHTSPAVLTGAASGIALFGTARMLRNWGATRAEQQAQMFGDETVPDPATVTTRAVTVYASAERVWCWLVQIGQDRGGMYSYDWLENLIGLDIHSTNETRSEWQNLAVGDPVRLVPRGWFGLADGLALTVSALDPGRSLVLRIGPWDAIWSFHVLSLDPDSCRLISRGRSPRGHGLRRLGDVLLDPITLVMTRKMLHGIKDRAERADRPAQPEPEPSEQART